MKSTCWLGVSSLLGAMALGLWLTGVLPGTAPPVEAAAEPPPQVEAPAAPKPVVPLVDRRKKEIEVPTERLLAGAAPPAAVPPAEPALTPKRAIERPVEKIVAAAAPLNFDNPKVEPGKVRWHASFDDACQAARRSGKPVLLFQLLGQLDQRFT